MFAWLILLFFLLMLPVGLLLLPVTLKWQVSYSDGAVKGGAVLRALGGAVRLTVSDSEAVSWHLLGRPWQRQSREKSSDSKKEVSKSKKVHSNRTKSMYIKAAVRQSPQWLPDLLRRIRFLPGELQLTGGTDQVQWAGLAHSLRAVSLPWLPDTLNCHIDIAFYSRPWQGISRGGACVRPLALLFWAAKWGTRLWHDVAKTN